MTRTRWLVPVALALVLAGCSSGGDSTPAPAPSTSAGDPPAAAGQRPGGGGTSGLIAYVSGQLMQVQTDDMQTAVTWTDATEITAQVPASLADVVPGVCVTATRSVAAGSSDAGEDAPVAQVAITQPVDGECGLTFGPMGGAGWDSDDLPSGFPTDRPEGFPTDLPEGARPGGMPTDMPTDMPMPGDMPDGMPGDMPGDMPGGGFGGVTAGLVTTVSGSTITVETTERDGTSSTATVTVDDATAYTTTAASDAGAIVVGQCVLARGEADSTGTVTATTLVVSAPTDGECTARGGFPGGDGMGGFPGGAAGGDD